MLIATLPTLTGPDQERLSEKIIRHPLIEAVRYNTGGDSPYPPKKILETLKPIAEKYGKLLYIDLEGRQVRVAKGSPQSRGSVTLNRDFAIELPALIHFRRMGWFDAVNAVPEERKIFFKPRKTREECYLGESQSVHVVAKNFEVQDAYLNGNDFDYISAAIELGINNFMLSFFEAADDLVEFYEMYYSNGACPCPPDPRIVLKIESQRGIEFLKNNPPSLFRECQLMAARDDLFLSFFGKRAEFLNALKLIVAKDRNAIVASRILSGLERHDEVTLGDMADIKLMSLFRYKHFMLSDELADCFDIAMQDWQEIIMPIMKEEENEK